MSYRAPVAEMRFAMEASAGLDALGATPGGIPDGETLTQILDAAADFAGREIAPLNWPADRAGASLENGVVRTAPGFVAAYRRYVDNGWNALPFDSAYGGQDLPWSVAVAVQEMWQAASLSFSLCPLLTQGAVELLAHHGSEGQKDAYLAKLVSGEWTGTMNLTEPQAGSDVGALKTRARRDAANDGVLGEAYRIVGTKIFITYGEHDMAENIVHMVLARVPDAPPGPKGVSLFLVPKFLPNGQRNDLRCVSLEHKLGINASPTCVMAFGDDGGALGWRIGQEGRGLECMFTMMNNARLTVGLQGIAIAERAYQAARAYAQTRVQGRAADSASHEAVAIVRHADVQRMLLDMKAKIEAARALAYSAHLSLDLAARAKDPALRHTHQLRVDLLTPVVKAWATDIGVAAASTGVQIHGGVGFVEETGAAQHYRDARILPIYEGTNGIQANDLAFRKVARDGGAAAHAFADEVAAIEALLVASGDDDLAAIAALLGPARAALVRATAFVVANAKSDVQAVGAVAVPYLELFGIVAGGALLAKGAAEAFRRVQSGADNAPFFAARIAVARFFADAELARAPSFVHTIEAGRGTAARMAAAFV
ncbi:MAG: acyl-CoA dehydrogenase [Magnetospirillum sp.]|nr:acyl-CoA dehydrogenase [Magnetospirillum sp.]